MIAGLDMDALCMKFPMSLSLHLYLSLPFSTAVVVFRNERASKKRREKVKDGIANFIEIRKCAVGNGSYCAILHSV